MSEQVFSFKDFATFLPLLGESVVGSLTEGDANRLATARAVTAVMTEDELLRAPALSGEEIEIIASRAGVPGGQFLQLLRRFQSVTEKGTSD
ncbi:hypothetical protein [Raineyella sp. W15-4]|uniref:hypothetical protein n=1 Tax=Raineyella sp. W15-4 TaxID=3081651 RepID=UPI0029538117|nr:hypothetical protein [Raineyella sp. W15-4]WOQ16052.1 hypothetical protein R0145_12630 [Raineyella sp. W15-4]